ncbi:MAG: hypothetical protein IJP70_11315 [Bacteroidales bacterium]|nr:hypothetical protein [Bacteroidales bacterium]
MILFFLYLFVMLSQVYWGMSDWWVLATNFLLSGLLVFITLFLLDRNRLVTKSGTHTLFQGWVLMSCVLNLSVICLPPSFPWWYLDVFLIALVGIFHLGAGIWQNSDSPLVCLELGAIVGALTWLDAQSLFWLILIIALLFHIRSVSFRNLCCVLTGAATSVWLIYCVLTLLVSPDSGDAYLQSFVQLVDWHLPVFPVFAEGFTGYVFIAFLLLVTIGYLFSGYFLYGISSLRTQAALHFISSMSLFLLVMLFFSYPTYFALLAVPIALHLLLSLGNDPTKTAIWSARIIIFLFILLGVGERCVDWVFFWIFQH